MTDTHLLTLIEGALAKSGMSRSQFGRKAASDSNLIQDLENGRELRSTLRDRVLLLIESINSSCDVSCGDGGGKAHSQDR